MEAFREIGALDKLGLLVLPFFVGDGQTLTPVFSKDTDLKLSSHELLGNGLVELTYDVIKGS